MWPLGFTNITFRMAQQMLQSIGLTIMFIFQTAKSICGRVLGPRPVRSCKQEHIELRLGPDKRYIQITLNIKETKNPTFMQRYIQNGN